MTIDCRDFDRLADPSTTAGPEERALWKRHVRGCARCQAQATADEALREGLGPAPELAVSPGFDASLRRQLAERNERAERRTRSRAARLLLVSYAALATALTAWILAGVDWSGAGPGRAAVALAVLAAVACPWLLVPRRARAPRLR